MTNESWQAAWELYRTARELPATEQHVLLGSLTNPEVLQEVVSLLDDPEEPIPEDEHDRRMPLLSSSASRYEIAECLGGGGDEGVHSRSATEEPQVTLSGGARRTTSEGLP